MNPDLKPPVRQALTWLKAHPHRDYIDAAFAVVADPKSHVQYPTHRILHPSNIATSRWPEFLEAVKEGLQNPAALS